MDDLMPQVAGLILDEDDDDAASVISSDSSGSDPTSTGRSTTGSDTEAHKEAKRVLDLTKTETHLIHCWRHIVLLLILGLGSLVSIGAFIVLKLDDDQRSTKAVSTT
jgi:hypothetical protein